MQSLDTERNEEENESKSGKGKSYTKKEVEGYGENKRGRNEKTVHHNLFQAMKVDSDLKIKIQMEK